MYNVSRNAFLYSRLSTTYPCTLPCALSSGKNYSLVPIVAQDYGTLAGMGYYSVIVARKDTQVTIGTLKGKKSCHTGYRRTSGWNIPIGYLLYNTTQGKANTGCDAQFASKFFSQSCVPGDAALLFLKKYLAQSLYQRNPCNHLPLPPRS